ncbi:MAG: NarK/NasA family nitrate transporter [Proteobacteria bacterium]|nr:NarK/NasA family nitrate transporter [Pseudomonadota bacterium]
MVWMMFAAIGIPLRKELGLNQAEFGLLASMPVLSGSLIRVPLGMWTDKYGGRIVMAILMAAAVPAVFVIGYASEYWHFLAIGLCMGIAGGSFSVGTPYVARWFPQRLQGTAMGVFGAGNSGAAINKFLAPVLIAYFGWRMVPQVYSAILLGTLVLFWLFSASNPAHLVPNTMRWTDQLRVMKDLRVLKYCQYYAIVFGGYVGLSLWLLQYYQGEYNLALPVAGLLTACFALPGGVVRAFGGYLSDRFGAHRVTWWVMWVCCTCLLLLSCPQADFTVATSTGLRTFHIGLDVTAFTVLLFALGLAMAIGKASVFKYIGDEYTANIGAVSGAVGLAGGLGGFVLPIMFGYLQDLTGVRSTAFALLFCMVWVSLIWMYWTEVRLRGADSSRSAKHDLQTA